MADRHPLNWEKQLIFVAIEDRNRVDPDDLTLSIGVSASLLSRELRRLGWACRAGVFHRPKVEALP